MAIDEEFEEDLDEDFESPRVEDRLEECQKDLKKLEHALYEFLEGLKHVTTTLSRDGQLSGEGHTKIMNLIDEYWHKRTPIEDQE